MTFRAKPVTTRKRRAHWENEERTQFWVTLGFLALIALALLVLGGAVAVGYYNEHFRTVVRVNGTEINRDEWLQRQQVEKFRLSKAESRIREALSAGTIDSATASQELQTLSGQQQDLGTRALDALIDQTLQAQLARNVGISATPAEVDAELRKEATTRERRKVLAVFVEPQKSAGATAPTAAQKAAARNRAAAALRELRAGKPFADVARRYSTDASRERGGDYGYVDATNPTDKRWIEALFKLPANGTTEVVEGADGTYRIGRVTEIRPAREDPGYAAEVDRAVGSAVYRKALEGDVVREKLKNRVVKDATTGDVEQVRAYEIVVRAEQAAQEGAAATQEARASHILYSPKDDPQGAGQVRANDPAWAVARRQADSAARRLRAVAAVPERERQFAALARTESDDKGSAPKGGDLGFFSRAVVAQEFGTAVFQGQHKRGDVIGPVKTQFGWHVILFREKGAEGTQRLAQILALVRKPGANFQQIARDRSEGDTAAQGGDLGWVARFQLEPEVENALFALQPGKVSEPVARDDGNHIYTITDRRKRRLDEKQRQAIEANGFENWYQRQKASAKIDRVEDALTAPTTPEPQ